MQETWIPSLGQKDPLRKELATHSSILVWRIPWTKEPGRLQFLGLQELDMTEWLNNKNSGKKGVAFLAWLLTDVLGTAMV